MNEQPIPDGDQKDAVGGSSPTAQVQPHLHVRLFGRLTLTWGQEALAPLRSSVARSLLAYLIVHRGRPIPREVLIGSFWPDRPEADGRKMLSNTLWQIRRDLDPAADRLQTDRHTVTLTLQPDDWLDIAVFEDHVQRCEAILSGGTSPLEDLPICLSELNMAVSIYRADFLEGCYDDWALSERERLRESYLWALGQLITLNKQWGNYDQALVHAQRLVAADPLRESAHCELIRLYYAMDRTRAALDQYTILCQLLAEELGVQPMASTRALHRKLAAAIDEAPAAHLPTAVAPPTPARLSRLPLVGRVEERTVLMEAIRAAIQGHGRPTLIEGAPGTGKTRLVEETVASARWHGMQVTVGRALPDESAPYQPLTDALTPLLSPLRLSQLRELVEPYHLEALQPILPKIATALPDRPATPDLPPAAQRNRLWQGLTHSIVALGTIKPLLLVLEDVHWADRASLNALKQIVPLLKESRVLLLLTCRTTEARQRPAVWEALSAFNQALPMERMVLHPLSLSEATLLLQQALAGGGKVSDDLARSLWQGTGGNPLLLIETLKSLLDRGLLCPSEVGWRLPAGELPPVMSDSVQALIQERLEHLPLPLRAVLETVALLGEAADFNTLARTTAMSPATLLVPLDELERLGFLQQTETAYCFEHDLIREGIYQAIAPGQRRELHRRVGQALEETHPERIEALAYHFDRGEVADKALAYTLQAAERAQTAHDYQTALACCERALALAGDDQALQWDILARQEQVSNVLGQREAQGEVLEQMFHLAERLNDPLRHAQTRHRQGWREVMAGNPARALELLDEATSLAREAGELDLLGRCLRESAYARWRIADITQCQAACEEARSIFRQTGNRLGESSMLNFLGNLHLGLLGHYTDALAYFEQGREIVRALDNPYREVPFQINIGICYSQLGLYQRSQEVLAEALQTVVHFGGRNRQGAIFHRQSVNYWALGDLDRAQDRAEAALRTCREVGDRNFEIESLKILGMIALSRGDPTAAHGYFEQGAAIAQADQQKIDWAICCARMALACLHLGQMEEALQLSAQAVATMLEWEDSGPYSKEVYFRHYQAVAMAEGTEAAHPELERAFRHLMEQAGHIEDPQLRRSFLEEIPVHREILAAYESGQPPPLRRRVRLPATSAPTGRPLEDDEFVEVTWTMFAPEDAGGDDPVTTRRRRLRRLLQEASEQGGAPTVADLAGVLNVHPRTIKRDLAALRAEGYNAPTRGQRK